MKILIFLFCILSILSLFGCSNQQDGLDSDKAVVSDQGNEVQKQETPIKAKEELIEEKGKIRVLD